MAGALDVAAEMCLASLWVTDDTSDMERACLDELARQPRLPEGLKVELERQAMPARGRIGVPAHAEAL